MALTGAVEVPPRDREVLESWLRSPSVRAGHALRARIVLMAADGVGTMEIARRVGVSKPTVISWKRRYRDEGVDGLDDRAKSGRPREIDETEIVARTLEEPPERLGVTHWSSRLLAVELGISNFTVAKVWQRWGLQPWRVETFKFSTDPESKPRSGCRRTLSAPAGQGRGPVRGREVPGPGPRADLPILPLRPGLPEKATHDYIRHGTTTLFAALEVATGRVLDACFDRHRHQEFLKFLKQVAKAYPRRKLHLVVDNYATHKHPVVRAWLARNPRGHAALHPDLGVLAQPRRGLLLDHHPPGHPPR